MHIFFRCEPFPTYPRTYDMLHANGLLSLLASERCSVRDLFLEMDRILRPEVSLLNPWEFSVAHAEMLHDFSIDNLCGSYKKNPLG